MSEVVHTPKNQIITTEQPLKGEVIDELPPEALASFAETTAHTLANGVDTSGLEPHEKIALALNIHKMATDTHRITGNNPED